MSALLDDIPDIPDDQHPAVLLAHAHELAQEAAELAEQAKAKRAESALLRARAERFRDGEHLRPARPKAEPPDPLLAAAGVAVEDLAGVWKSADLAALLEIRETRASKIVLALEAMEVVARSGDGWRTSDPEEARVRDALRELGTCTREQLAERLELSPQALTYYIDLWAERGYCNIAHDDHLMYLRPSPSPGPAERPRRLPPERDRPAYTDAPARGLPVRLEDHAKRGKAGSRPGERQRLKMRDKRREDMEKARAARSERSRAKAAQSGRGGRKK